MAFENHISIVSLGDEQSLRLGAELLSRGELVVAHAGTVFGIFVNAEEPTAVTRALAVKGEVDEPENKPLSLIIGSDRLARLVDTTRVHASLQKLFTDPNYIGLLAGICHLRVPVTKEAVDCLPQSVVSWETNGPYVHGLDIGDRALVSMFILAANKGVKHIACTTWNDGDPDRKEPEITTFYRAKQFAIERPAVTALFIDPNPSPAVGSFAILDTARGRMIRDGHIPARVIQQILDVELDYSEMLPAKYHQLHEFDTLLAQNLSPMVLRQKVIDLVFPHAS